MANFKVGQRVRKVRMNPPRLQVIPLGTEGVIVAERDADGEYGVRWNCDMAGFGFLYASSWMLAPLTDPKADAFIESLKKLAREPQPAAPVDVRQ